MNRRDFLRRSAIAGVVGATGVGSYAFAVEPHWVQVVRRELPVDRLPPSLVGLRMVQLSDLHVGPRVDDGYLVDTFARASALRPDILVITGDFLTHRTRRGEAQYAQLRDVLAHLPRGRLATVGILGNHDFGPGWRDGGVAVRVAAEAERAGVQLLRNASVNVGGLDLVGVDDLWSGRADLRTALAQRTGSAAIVLCHNPDGLDALPWGDYRGWVLAGHTHGGQCKPPFLPPPVLPVRNPRYTAGEIAAGAGRRVYINRGLGHLIRVRFNVRPEITEFALAALAEPVHATAAGAGAAWP